MSYLHSDPEAFAQQAADGFASAHPGIVRRVPGGVVRAGRTPGGQVAVVIGGGSGHYPAFAGLVGPGLAHGAAMGEVFASPSAHRVWSVGRTAASDAGVLLTYGNYAGDVLNFDQAAERLRADGIPVESVPVTDDIASATPDERERRRGIAGDLAVFRAAAWAAEQGRSLAEVAEFARYANARTSTLGVAFTGCTLPGATEPLFTVPAGRMAIGMGIHGEPGIETVELAPAPEIARLLVDRLLAERPADADGRVAVIVNGLGAVKSEELYLLYGEIAPLLEGAGLTIVEPEVGEYATSFEMAGVSLTLFWLDDGLAEAWHSPAASVAYRKGAAIEQELDEDDVVEAPAASEHLVAVGSEDSRAAGAIVRRGLDLVAVTLEDYADDLGRLDAVAGDGDHGIGMHHGSAAASDAASRTNAVGGGAGSVLKAAGDAWADRAGGTSGALWGAALRAPGERIGDSATPTAQDVADAVNAARDAILEFGKARPGDKTMVDALVPFADGLAAAIAEGTELDAAWDAAARTATSAAAATARLTPRLGRARPHAEKSVGTPDPGAVSFALAVTAAGSTLSKNGAVR